KLDLRKRPYIWVNGKRYVLDFGKDTALEQLARKFDGQSVLLTGTLGEKQIFVDDQGYHAKMQRTGLVQLQVVNVTGLEAKTGAGAHRVQFVQLKGPFEMEGAWPDWSNANGRKYPVSFGSDELPRRAEKIEPGKPAVVTGTVASGPDMNLFIFDVTVSDVRAEEGQEYVRRQEQVEIRGRLVRATAVPDSVAYKGLSHLITRNGKAYWLDFA